MPLPTKPEAKSAKAATLRDVAARAGVSLATASRAINSSDAVHADTSQLVWNAARALGFRPNIIGRSLRATRTKMLGLMLPALDHPVFAECLRSIEAHAREQGYALAVAATAYDAAAEERLSERLLAQRVDGLILTVANATQSQLLNKLDAEGTPYVLAFNQVQGPKKLLRPCVAVDNRLAARHMVEHLIALGHRDIAFLSGPFDQSDRAAQRHKGYCAAMRAAGAAERPPLALRFDDPDMRAALQDLLGNRKRPSALFCANDQLALGVVRDLTRMGLSVPGDVSVAGFDGVRLGNFLTPSLSTVVQPIADIGRTSVDLLLQLIEGQRYRGPALLHHTLRNGQSAAAVPFSRPQNSGVNR